MNRMKIFSKALLLLLVSLLTFAATSCSDDETEGWDGTYGYVQFKLSKKVSSRATRAAALDKLEKLDDAKKIKVVMEHITTKDAAEFVINSPSTVAATITAHHLLYNRNAIFLVMPPTKDAKPSRHNSVSRPWAVASASSA